MTTTSPRSRPALAAVALAGALALASCGGGDEDPDDAEPGSSADETADAPTESPSESASGDESASESTSDGPPEGVPSVEAEWPEGWEDMSPYISAAPEDADVQAWGDPQVDLATAVVVMAFPESSVGGSTYLELLEEQGADLSTYAELAPREIDGVTVTPYETVVEAEEGLVVQHLYPVELEDGSLVEITLIADQATFAEAMPQFEQTLDSIQID